MSTQTRIVYRILRFALGILFLWSGLSKAMTGFSAEAFLHASSGPFASFFQLLAGNQVVDFLVVFGEIGIGLSLLSTLFIPLATWAGMVMMVLFYLAKFPPEGSWINHQVIYFLVFWLINVVRSNEDHELERLTSHHA